ncbi:MAG: DUF928 domain-containing protein [Oscillatoriophycideae cyanobacterium NC_groundwater_1537_Pr4_S-0.65um_50_18]|nr:DUF928 domain-containing protein [Oscillatoriophycideae cyanobacterium NC_groundwater_1537_Pr4_S-0.65um_50_18]
MKLSTKLSVNLFLLLIPTLTLTLALSLINSLSLSTLQAAPLTRLASFSYTPPPPPPDRGAPGSRGEGASRSCKAGSLPLMALVPEQTLSATPGAAPITQVWGLTSTDHPRFWFAMPYAATQVSAIEFVLQNSQDQTVYRTPISVPAAPGIMAVSLPTTVNGLEPNQPYHWFFKVRAVCEPNQAATLDYVEGWIQRTPLDPGLRDRLTQSTPRQQAVLYAENGIWYDALTTLADLKLAQPDDRAIAQDWTDLLKAVGLENLADQPLLR